MHLGISICATRKTGQSCLKVTEELPERFKEQINQLRKLKVNEIIIGKYERAEQETANVSCKTFLCAEKWLYDFIVSFGTPAFILYLGGPMLLEIALKLGLD